MGWCGRGCCGDVGGWWFGWWPAPLGRPVALTLALSRRAGEGTVVVAKDSSASAELLKWSVAVNFGHPLRAAHASLSLSEE